VINSIECQDAILIERDPERLFFGIADGAGSAKRAKEGADQALLAAKEFIWESENLVIVKDELLPFIQSKLESYATAIGCSFQDLSSTLLLAFITGKQLLFVQIGDGSIAIRDDSGSFTRMFPPQKGEYLNETVFVTSKHSKVNVQSKVLELSPTQVVEFVLMTDGIEEKLFNRKTLQYANAVGVFFDWLKDGDEAEVQAAITENIRKKIYPSTTDDLTICGVQYVTPVEEIVIPVLEEVVLAPVLKDAALEPVPEDVVTETIPEALEKALLQETVMDAPVQEVPVMKLGFVKRILRWFGFGR
jgi:serine/threonine protein phosphatase PrpC